MLKEAAEATSLGKEWLNEAPRKYELALLREGRNMQLPGTVVRKAIKAGRTDDWSELMKSDELNPSVMAKLKESHGEAGR